MFSAAGDPIGVGPDGEHYLADGTEINKSEPHFDAEGATIAAEAVKAAQAVADQVNVAIKVRARMKPEGADVEAVDVLGRTFRPSKEERTNPAAASGMMVNADGVSVPLMTARRLVNAQGEVVKHVDVRREAQKGSLVIQSEDEDDAKKLGAVEIDENSTMADVRRLIRQDVGGDFGDFVFVINFVPLTKSDEEGRLAMACLPEVLIRGITLKPNPTKGQFSRKVNEMMSYEQEKQHEAVQFDDIMARVRNGNFLRKVNPPK